MMRRMALAVCCVALVAAGAVYYLARPSGEAAPPSVDPLQDATARLERELETELQSRARGLATDWDVDAARVTLAKARHDLALTAGDRAEMRKQLEVVLAAWEREWERVRPAVERGVLSPAEADDARRRLAVARYRLADFDGKKSEAEEQLQLVATNWNRLAQRLTQAHASRAVSIRDLNLARYEAGCARYVIARTGDRREDIRVEIDRAVTLWEAEAGRVGRLHETGVASHFENFQARHYLATVRLRRSTYEGNREAAAEQLRARIKVAEEALPGLDMTDPFLRRQRPRIEWGRAYDVMSLSRLQREGVFPPDTAAADLDW